MSFLVISPSAQDLDAVHESLFTRPAFTIASVSTTAPSSKRPQRSLEVDDRVVGGEIVVIKAAFGDTSLQGHLAAFKTGAYTAAASGVLSLMALARSLAVTGAGASADAEMILLWSRGPVLIRAVS